MQARCTEEVVHNGFVDDARRINVGLTRARHALWILGNKETLTSSKSDDWKELFIEAEKGRCLVEVPRDPWELFPELG